MKNYVIAALYNENGKPTMTPLGQFKVDPEASHADRTFLSLKVASGIATNLHAVEGLLPCAVNELEFATQIMQQANLMGYPMAFEYQEAPSGERGFVVSVDGNAPRDFFSPSLMFALGEAFAHVRRSFEKNPEPTIYGPSGREAR